MAKKTNHKPLKILMLSHISDIGGGAEMSMLEVLDYWVKYYNAQVEIILRLPLKKMVSELDKRDWKYHAINYTFWSDNQPDKLPQDLIAQAKTNQQAIQEIERIIGESAPDVVMTNTIICPWAAFAAYNTQTPHIWFVREYGDLDHGRTYSIGRDNTYYDVETTSNLVVANSKTLRDYLKKYIRSDKLTYLYHPFNIEQLKKSATAKVDSPYKYKDSIKLIILAGSVTMSKGQLEAVEAVGKLKEKNMIAEVCILGRRDNMDYNKLIDQAIEKYKIKDQVHFVGFTDQKMAYVKYADIGIMASRMEAFGRTTFEFLAAGKAVIGANGGATPEMVHDRKNGYLFDPLNSDSLTKALLHYKDNKLLLKKHSKESEKIAETMMNGTHNIDTLYESVLVALNTKRENRKLKYPIEINKQISVAKKLIKTDTSLHKKLEFIIKKILKQIYYPLRSLLAKVRGY